MYFNTPILIINSTFIRILVLRVALGTLYGSIPINNILMLQLVVFSDIVFPNVELITQLLGMRV